MKADGCQVKKLMIALEETKIGRLYDIDVLKKKIRKSAERILISGKKMSVMRQPGLPVWQKQKTFDRRIEKKIYGIIWEEQLQRGVAAEISQALMEEVYTTPKTRLSRPGGYRCAYRYELSDISKEYRGDRRRSGGNV